VRSPHLSHGIWLVEHGLLGLRLTPTRTAALLEVIAIVRRDLPAEITKLCKTHAEDVVASLFEVDHVATSWADLEVFAPDLTFYGSGYFLWIDARFTLGQPLRDAVKKFGRENGCKVLCVENIRAKSRRPSVVIFECQLEYACNADGADHVSIFGLPGLVIGGVVVSGARGTLPVTDMAGVQLEHRHDGVGMGVRLGV